MNPSRPLPKALLKKLFLKVLHEHKRPNGFYQGHGWSYEGILRNKITEYFKIESRLTDDEYAEAFRAVYELERDGYIMRDPGQSQDHKILTSKGKTVVEKELDDMKLPSIDIDQLIDRDDLKDKVHDDYLLSDFETAISKAFKLIEENVRAKAGLPPDCVGADLMTKSFNPKGGILKHPNAKTPGEEEALHLLMRSAMMWFRNPVSHRTVGYQDDVQAAHVLGFANFILNIVDECF